jgi:Flp pilus assembly protein TadB
MTSSSSSSFSHDLNIHPLLARTKTPLLTKSKSFSKEKKLPTSSLLENPRKKFLSLFLLLFVLLLLLLLLLFLLLLVLVLHYLFLLLLLLLLLCFHLLFLFLLLLHHPHISPFLLSFPQEEGKKNTPTHTKTNNTVT